jgi:tetratricopeptide repeat protein 8
VRPVSSSGRPMTGFQRPGTNRAATGASRGNLSTALAGVRQGTSKPMTSGGRMVRLGTASLVQ